MWRAVVPEVVAFVDDDVRKQESEVWGVPVFVGQSAVGALREQGVEGAIAAIGDNKLRLRVTDRLRDCGYRIINAIHPQAMVDDTAQFRVCVIAEW